MIAFDSNILREIWKDNPVFLARANLIPPEEQAVPAIVIEEALRGRLNVIRQAEAGKAKVSLTEAYDIFVRTVDEMRGYAILSYTVAADHQFQEWRKQKIRVATHDLRIAAICIAYNVTLVTRNRRDFERIPDLSVEFW
ncbi:MAG: type II toxin-antitoxin system VapC family toxin [Acidobacteria bacterium]|nr:type II toxin-antitoxin system VapC family toxin [Acidobacteriota bacterium]